MKTGLLAASAGAVLLIAALLFWRTRPDAVPTAHVPSDAPPSTQAPSQGLSTEARQNAPTVQLASRDTRTAAAATPEPGPKSESAVPLVAELADPNAGSSIDSSRAGEYKAFAEKYRSTSFQDRRLARETIEAMLLSNKQGIGGKGMALSEEQVLGLSHEIEWLESNPNP